MRPMHFVKEFVTPPGQVEFIGEIAPYTGSITNARTDTWIVPPGVYSICCVCVGATVTVAGVVVCRAPGAYEATTRIGDGGGNGGASDTIWDSPSGMYYQDGGGGAGGYTGNGGSKEGNGAGGGGGSGGGWIGTDSGPNSGVGGGVGLKGQGANGAGRTSARNGLPGSGGTGAHYGGGAPGGRGSSTSWKNNIAVVPGQVVTIALARSNTRSHGGYNYNGGRQACRIIWGPGRSYPTNAADV